jgi:hypothetical protein
MSAFFGFYARILCSATIGKPHDTSRPDHGFTAVASKTPLQVMKNRHKLKPKSVKTRPYYLPNCDN